MKIIFLKGKRGAFKFATVDREDYEYLSQFRWNLNKDGYVVRTSTPSERARGYPNSVRMHREVMGVFNANITVDHKFHNKLDNRKKMLRVCTILQNNMNSAKRKGCSSKYKGVSWIGRLSKWIARISIKGVFTNLGCFKTEEEAGLAYNQKAIELFGEFALLNEIE